MKPQPPELVPEEGRDATVRAPATVAGGVPSIAASMSHAARHMGIVRGARALLALNQPEGFDCPGCAWPEPEHRAIAEFCENGAKAVASEATTKRVGPELFAARSVAELATESDFWLNDQGRLTHPMVRRQGATHYEPIEWEEAFALVAKELQALASPDEAIFYTSGRTSNEAAFLYQLFARQLGTNNLPDCSNMCHESSGWALRESIGVGKSTVGLEDFEHADAVFVIGQNPGTNHPRMLTTLEAAVKRGCTVVSINPLAETGTARFAHPQDLVGILGRGTPLARLHLPVRINGDLALLRGIIKEMLEEEARRPGTVLDREFIREHTDGFEAFAAAVRAASWDDLVLASGISREQIREAASIAMGSRATIACWAMGLTQHKNAVATIQEVVHLLLLRGDIGRPGAGVCPVRGHSNVQGDRTMGIWERMEDEFLDRLGAEFKFAPPRHHGKDTVDAIHAMRAGEAKVFVGLGGNFLSATPDTTRTAEGLARCRLTVQIATKLNRGHLVTGDVALLLPCLGRTEIDDGKFVTVENSMGVVHASKGVLKPASEALLSEIAIVCGLAKATLGARSGVAWEKLAEDYDGIREHIARVVPGFEDFNLRVRGEKGKRGFTLPNAARERVFETASGKARFVVNELTIAKLAPGQLLMMTIRSHDQYNTTVYANDDRYRGVAGGRRVVFLHEQDIAERGLAAGELVDLTSHFEDGERVAPRFQVVAYAIPKGCAATYFPETNVLVPLGSVADKSNTPTSKSVVITVRRAAKPASALLEPRR